MDKAYEGYSYKRYKRPRRVFLWVFAALFIGVAFLAANLIFGFVDFGFASRSTNTFTMPSMTFYAAESEEFAVKSEALDKSNQIKNAGGSGYLRKSTGGMRGNVTGNESSEDTEKAGRSGKTGAAKETWKVIQSVDIVKKDGMTEFTAPEKTIALSDKTHSETVRKITESFRITLETLCGYAVHFEKGTMTQSEIADGARLSYNNLITLSGVFQNIQSDAKSPAYAQVSVYITRQLLGLNIVWVDGASRNFSHILQNAASWVAFAYLDLCAALP